MSAQSPREDVAGHSAVQELPPSQPLPAPPERPHRIEEDVQRELLAHPDLRFSTLVIRRLPGGVCLEGVLNVNESMPDLCSLARSVNGVEQVVNHLVVRQSQPDAVSG